VDEQPHLIVFNDLEAGSPRLLFKGGTSLSKAFDLTPPFSEDIDITVFRRGLQATRGHWLASRAGNSSGPSREFDGTCREGAGYAARTGRATGFRFQVHRPLARVAACDR